MNEINNNPVFTLTVGQLEPIIKNWIHDVMCEIQPKPEETTAYLTRKEACEKLHISLPTLSHYSNLGLISAKRIGNRILYLEADIETALKDIPTRKYNK